MITVTRKDGRIFHPATRQEAIILLKQAQAEGDRFATVWGAGDQSEIEKEAGYNGATESECIRECEKI
jgi:hypothetical protein